jgi:D-alanyl-D-alanine endopeptidase (penicillin-binding protein 7)
MLFMSSLAHSNELTAQAWVITDENNNPIAGENIYQVRSIASITKLVTAISILRSGVDIDQKVQVKPFGLVSRRQLLDMALVRSNNIAAESLCQLYDLGYRMCIEDMNANLARLGMNYSVVYDATGLDRRNKSTAMDLVKLVNEASKYPEIVSASSQSDVRIKIRKRWVLFKNTNPMIGHRQNIIVSKTGFTRPAGGCLAMLMSTEKGNRAVIVLGSKNTHTRIPEAEFISDTYLYN